MPLHLLGKKSWNVYNVDNITRVQRDEAAAAAAEQAAEQRMQEVDAARRLAILRGETPPPLPEAEPEIDPSDRRFTRRDRDSSGFRSKKRKRAGEDDTDFEMRLARERAETGGKVTAEIAQAGGDVDIVDKARHIDLVGAPPAPAPAAEKNPDFEREAAKKRRELEDQYQMRFSNAAGRDGFAAGAPWYAKADSRRAGVAAPADAAASTTKEDVVAEIGIEAPTKNVWGIDDPRRKLRSVQRLNTDDPLAMMKTGARRVREVEKERRRGAEERGQELKDLRREERRQEKRRREDRRHKDKDDDDARSRSHHSQHSERRHEGGRRGEGRHSHRDDEPEGRRDRDRDRDRHRERHRDRSRAEDRSCERERSRREYGDYEDRRREGRKHHGDGDH